MPSDDVTTNYARTPAAKENIENDGTVASTGKLIVWYTTDFDINNRGREWIC